MCCSQTAAQLPARYRQADSASAAAAAELDASPTSLWRGQLHELSMHKGKRLQDDRLQVGLLLEHGRRLCQHACKERPAPGATAPPQVALLVCHCRVPPAIERWPPPPGMQGGVESPEGQPRAKEGHTSLPMHQPPQQARQEAQPSTPRALGKPVARRRTPTFSTRPGTFSPAPSLSPPATPSQPACPSPRLPPCACPAVWGSPPACQLGLARLCTLDL